MAYHLVGCLVVMTVVIMDVDLVAWMVASKAVMLEFSMVERLVELKVFLMADYLVVC